MKFLQNIASENVAQNLTENENSGQLWPAQLVPAGNLETFCVHVFEKAPIFHIWKSFKTHGKNIASDKHVAQN